MEQRFLRVCFIGAALANLAGWAWIYFAIPEFNFPFIIKHTINSPSDFWGTRFDLFLVPFLGLIILGANVIVSYGVYHKQSRLSLIVAATALFCQVMVLLYAFATVYVNTY